MRTQGRNSPHQKKRDELEQSIRVTKENIVE